MTELLAAARYNPTLDTLYGTVCTVCFLFGTFGNTLSLLYFSRRPDLSSFLYTCISWIDLAICITVLPMGLLMSLLMGRLEQLLSCAIRL